MRSASKAARTCRCKTVAPADVTPGQIFTGGAGVNSGVQTGSINAVDVATGKQVAQAADPVPDV